MELYLIRHGQSEGNAGIDLRPDPQLTPLGLQQAHRVAYRLQQENLDFLYASPAIRALQTAQIISQQLGLPLNVWVDLCERVEQGTHPGLTRSQIRERFPEAILPENVTESGWWFLSGEDEAHAYQRAARVETRIRSLYEVSDFRVGLIGHGTFGSILISRLLGVPLCGYTQFSQHNGCISRLELLPGRAKLRVLNQVTHLAANALT